MEHLVQCPSCLKTANLEETVNDKWFTLSGVGRNTFWFDRVTCIRMWSGETILRDDAPST